MDKWLLQHSWKSMIRSSDFHRKLVVNIIFGLMISVFVLEVFLFGFFLTRILREDLAPGRNPVEVVNGVLLLYFGFELVFRIFMQKRRLFSGKQYLLLRVKRKTIAHFLLFKTVWTLINIFGLLIIVPFFFRGVAQEYSFGSSVAWLVSILSLLLFNTYLANYVRLRLIRNPVKTVPFVLILIGMIILEYYKILSLTSFSSALFNTLLTYPFAAIIPIVLLVLVYLLNHEFLVHNLYVENLHSVTARRSMQTQFHFLQGLGEAGKFISLDIKLMLRNKRTRLTLFMPLFFIFYGLLFYPGGEFHKETVFVDCMLMFIGTFITGFFIMSYGMTVFCYESKYFGLLLTNNISMSTYIKSKYYFMLIVTMLMYGLSLFYVVYGNKIFIVNSVMFLFNIGVTPFVVMYLATFNKLRFDLDANAFSMQGKGANQMSMVFILVIVLYIFYIPIRLLFNQYIGLGIMGILGITGFLFHKKLLGLLYRQFLKRRYVMSQGFRQP